MDIREVVGLLDKYGTKRPVDGLLILSFIKSQQSQIDQLEADKLELATILKNELIKFDVID